MLASIEQALGTNGVLECNILAKPERLAFSGATR
jgi:hypothetical protein